MDSRNTGRRNYISYNDYIEGNAVRKQVVVPKITEEPKRENVNPQRTERVYVGNQRVTASRHAMRKREKALQMSKPYVIMLAACLMVMAFLCVQYLSIKNELSDTTNLIASTEIDTDSLKAHNDSVEYGINSYKDFDYISNSAVNELGMVRASADQIIFYESSDSEYMKQYKDIPSN